MIPIIGQKGVEIEPVIEIVEAIKFDTVMREMRMAASVGNHLANVYPGYFWLINVDFQGGILTIECGQINSEVMSNMTYRQVVHLKNLVFDWAAGMKKVEKAAGELLERAYLRRGKWDASYPSRIDGVKDEHQPWTGRRVVSLDEYRRRAQSIEIIKAA
jgi:hypothetical protein